MHVGYRCLMYEDQVQIAALCRILDGSGAEVGRAGISPPAPDMLVNIASPHTPHDDDPIASCLLRVIRDSF